MIQILLFLLSFTLLASTKTICGSSDDRRLSFAKEIGRAVKPNAVVGCTITLIGKSCAISAGHCIQDLKVAQFNLNKSAWGELEARPEDTYLIDSKSIVSQNSGHGKDWAVFRLHKNAVTKLLPGEVQGYLHITHAHPQKGTAITITGFGWLSVTEKKLSPQQTHTSHLLAAEKGVLYYDVDTMGGNSGSALINDRGQIIGVHTHGYCSDDGGANQGTMLAQQSKFKAAVKNCLSRDQ